MSIAVALGSYYQRTANPPPRTAYTICGWAKWLATTGFTCLASVEDASSSAANGTYIGWRGDTVTR